MTKEAAESLRQRAAHYRMLARQMLDPATQEGLNNMAREFEARAAAEENDGTGPSPTQPPET